MFTFKKGQIIVVKKSGLMPSGQFELVDVVSTPQGSYNLRLKDVKSGSTIVKGRSIVESVLRTSNGSELYNDEEELEKGKITGTSKWAEKRVRQIIVKSYKAREVSDGDVWYSFYIDEQDEGSLVLSKIEVKSANSSDTKEKDSYGANQVRPMKYHILVVVVENLNQFDCGFLVYPANKVIQYALKKRGQHTPDSLACCNMSCDVRDAVKFGCNADELEDRIRQAYIEDYFNKNALIFKQIAEDRRSKYESIVVENYTYYKKYVDDQADCLV